MKTNLNQSIVEALGPVQIDAWKTSGSSPPPAETGQWAGRLVALAAGQALVSADRLAQVLGVHPETVYRHARAGDLPCYRMGPCLRFDLDDVLAHLQAEAVRRASNGSSPSARAD